MTMQEDHDRLIRLETKSDGVRETLERIETVVNAQTADGVQAHTDLWDGVRKAQDQAKSASIWSRIGTSLWGMTIAAVLVALGLRER